MPIAITLSKMIMKNWHILNDIPGCKEKLKTRQRNVNNLKKNLVRVDVDRRRIEEDSATGFVRRGNCNVCTHSWGNFLN